MPVFPQRFPTSRFKSDFFTQQDIEGEQLRAGRPPLLQRSSGRNQAVITGVARRNLEMEGLGEIARSPLFEQVVGQGNTADQPLLGGMLVKARRAKERRERPVPLSFVPPTPGFDRFFGALQLAQLRQSGEGQAQIRLPGLKTLPTGSANFRDIHKQQQRSPRDLELEQLLRDELPQLFRSGI